MKLRWPWAKAEKRAGGSGFTAEIMAARASYIAGRSGVAELTATAQSCVSLWENGFALADVDGAPMLSRATMGMIGRSLALRGEAVFLIRDGLVPVSDWDLSTRNGRPTAYRLSISEAGGGRTETALAGEVLHFRIGVHPAAPWGGTAPLRRASLTSGMLQSVETALLDIFNEAPLGSMVVPLEVSGSENWDLVKQHLSGKRGGIMLREPVRSSTGYGSPVTDYRPQNLTPNLEQAQLVEALQAARASIYAAFGVLPGLFVEAAQGPLVREAQRHLAQWTLQPMLTMMADEAGEKLGSKVTLDCTRPLQAYDAGGRARALATLVEAAARAKEAGIEIGNFATLVDWAE